MNKPPPKIYPTPHGYSYNRALIHWGGNIIIWFIPLGNNMLQKKVNKDEITPIPMQPSNTA